VGHVGECMRVDLAVRDAVFVRVGAHGRGVLEEQRRLLLEVARGQRVSELVRGVLQLRIAVERARRRREICRRHQ